MLCKSLVLDMSLHALVGWGHRHRGGTNRVRPQMRTS